MFLDAASLILYERVTVSPTPTDVELAEILQFVGAVAYENSSK